MTIENEETTTYPVEDGALTEVPAYSDHQRGKNWLARIEADPRSPSGLARDFLEKAYGPNYFYMVGGLSRGDALEFGADYYSGSGRKSPYRIYAAVASVSENVLELALFEEARDALEASAEYRDAPSVASSLPAEELELARRIAAFPDDRARLIVQASTELRNTEESEVEVVK